ncbi:MAG TPA: PIG-L family deacetylase [Prolixibacteraceae bacterium]|jgi:LmbE family N-acetylglucosaminyl deacetylase|nr:PIG-L family deacetylase [Prolixibacteraceae bacterium]
MKLDEFKNVALIVAHPDDETLWAGGIILSKPKWNVFVLSLCRASDQDRAPKFAQALNALGAKGTMGDLDDSPLQQPLNEEDIQEVIIDLLPVRQYDLVITHHPRGEYTRHLRHEEIGKAVIKLWSKGNITSHQLWCFAYEDGGREYYPKAVETGTFVFPLDKGIWERKYKLIRETYGFDKNSWEAHTTPTTESFWQFVNPEDAMQWLSSLPES